ncbi:hypothetical protein CC80DRAFT_423187 [Byssothecium circinans]|uniref:Uncharacterized protein n=1 Tax=Byssothecium circinans TaxID=147558 RepID=A0A6A5TJB6_9PLEO|nr:hypothetical protein CC80DRAFT_423187 [Byssothecium circinans]
MKEAGSLHGWCTEFRASLFTLSFIVTIVCLHLLHRRATKMHHEGTTTFPFLELPAELRIRVYENLLEDPEYPPPPPPAKHPGSPLNWMLRDSWLPGLTPAPVNPQTHGKHQSNWLFLANKQVYAEYMDIVCKKSTFHLTVSPYNYTATTIVTPSITWPQPTKIWNISPDVLKSLRKCDVKLITTTPLLSVEDPRNMQPGDWALARQVRAELKGAQSLSELSLHVKAIGDPMWNPLWMWYHASQSLKSMGTATADEEPAGPKLNRITFSLDSWSPGENYLERDAENGGRWAWWCMKGHCTGVDGADVTVREFCSALYNECRECRPVLESDVEESEDSGDEDKDEEEE